MKESEHSYYQNLKKSKNALLVRAEIGKAKECVRKLPPPDHSYGHKLKADNENAGALISSWQTHQPTKDSQSNKDYSKLNKLGVVNKITDPKQVKQFREKHDVHVKKLKGKLEVSQKPIHDDFVFGIKNKPSTPIKNLVQFDYGNQAMVQTHKVYLQSPGEKPQENKAKAEVSLTPSPPDKKLFKLQKFSNIKGKIKIGQGEQKKK